MSWKFSNFRSFPSPLNAYDVAFSTPEHLYQALKTTNLDKRKAILALPTPGQAKRMGKRVALRPDWESIKLDVMIYVQQVRFDHDQVFHYNLLTAQDPELFEWNTWHDNIWGGCTCSRCKDKPKQHLLQKALAAVKNRAIEV